MPWAQNKKSGKINSCLDSLHKTWQGHDAQEGGSNWALFVVAFDKRLIVHIREIRETLI